MMKKLLLISTIICGASFAAPSTQAAQSGLNSERSYASIQTISASAEAISSAEKFVAKVADDGIGFLSDSSLNQQQRKSAFKKLLKKNFDMKTIARFALGRHWRNASPAQQKEYLSLFEKMVLDVYAQRFNEYSGEKLAINGARAEGKKDVLVNSKITSAKGQKIKVDWRVRNKSGKNKVIDIMVEGVSMSLTQRSDFSSVIQRGGGDIEVLLEHLRKQ